MSETVRPQFTHFHHHENLEPHTALVLKFFVSDFGVCKIIYEYISELLMVYTVN